MRPEDLTLWRSPQAWERVAGGVRPRLQVQEAVKILFPGEKRQAVNQHVLAVGDRPHLIDLAEEFFCRIKEGYGFGQGHHWDRQRQWLIELFARFFAADCDVGWVSLTTERRPSHARKHQDLGVTVRDDRGSVPPTPLFPATDIVGGRALELYPGGRELLVPTKGLYLHNGGADARSAAGQVFLIHSPRTVEAPNFGVRHSYCEFWACLGLPGRDEGDLERLARGQIPAVSPELYRTGPDRLRVNPMLSLFKVDLRRGSSTYFGVEIHRESGGVLDLRTTCAPLDATILMASIVERTAIARSLIDSKRPTMTGSVAPPRPVPSPVEPPRLLFHARPGLALQPALDQKCAVGSHGLQGPLAQFLSNVEGWVKNAWNRLGTSRQPSQPARQSAGCFEIYPLLTPPDHSLPANVPETLEREIENALAAVTALEYGEREVGAGTTDGGCRLRVVFYRASSPFETDTQYANARNKVEAALTEPSRKRADMMTPLQFFWAVAEERSFSGAGKRLYPGEQTRAGQVKRNVTKLTDLLGLGALIAVNTTGVFEDLTVAGRALYEYLQQRIDLSRELNALGPGRFDCD